MADIEFAREIARTGDLDEGIRLLGTVIERAQPPRAPWARTVRPVEALVEPAPPTAHTPRTLHAAESAIARLAE
jgi:hypothetical protein